MFLTFDIGNTNIVIGLFNGDELVHKWRLNTLKKSVDDYAVDMVELFLTDQVDCLKIEKVVIASVVPNLTNVIVEAVKKFTAPNIEISVFGDDKNKLGKFGNSEIEILVNAKNEVGHDRLINAIAAYHKFGGNLIIIDLGTATTFDVVGEKGEYLGGAISPGINLSLKALHDMTAQLPKISIKAQKNVIGKSTIEAMNSGVYFGYISLIEGMVTKIEKEFGKNCKKIITGGLAEVLKEPLKNLIDHHEPNLTLEGLKIAFEDQQNS